METTTSNGPQPDEPDQDAEPTMTAPEEGRPDALHALKDVDAASDREGSEGSAGAGPGEEAGSPS